MRFKDDLQKYIYYQSQIDFCYWAIHEYNNLLYDPKSVLAFTKSEIKSLVKTIIKCKTKLGIEVDEDKKLLKNLPK